MAYRAKEEIEEAIKNSISIAESLRNLGLQARGNNYKSIHKWINQYNIDTTHWLGQAHLAGKKREYKKARPLSEYLQNDIWLGSASKFKNRLIKEKLLEEVCDICKIGNTWQQKPLILQLDHRNGIHKDNRLENLRLLCPNCHSQTDTYCGRNNRFLNNKQYGPIKPRKSHTRKKLNACKTCNNACVNKYCSVECTNKNASKINWPPKEELQELVWLESMVKLSKKLGVSDVAIKRRCQKYEIKLPPYGYWAQKKLTTKTYM